MSLSTFQSAPCHGWAELSIISKGLLRRVDAAAPTPIVSRSEVSETTNEIEDYLLMAVCDHTPDHRDKIQGALAMVRNGDKAAHQQRVQ
eukprot:2807505-Amphidinium_carterae.3